MSGIPVQIVNIIGPGRTYSVAIGTTSAPIIGAGNSRTRLTFHNPTAQDVYVCQASDVNGNALPATVPSGSNGGGMWLVIAGSSLIVDSPGSGAWNGIASAPTCLTILEQTGS